MLSVGSIPEDEEEVDDVSSSYDKVGQQNFLNDKVKLPSFIEIADDILSFTETIDIFKSWNVACCQRLSV